MPPNSEGAMVGVQIRGAKTEAKAGPSPAEIRSQQQARMDEGKRRITELQQKGVDFGTLGKQTPSDIIKGINKSSGDKWRNNLKTQEYVGEAVSLQRELQMEVLSLKMQMLQKNESVVDEAAIAAQAEINVLERRVQAAMPPEAIVPDSKVDSNALQPKTAEQIAKENKAAAEKRAAKDKADKAAAEATVEAARLKGIEDATQAWVDRGAIGDEARPVLDYIVAEEADRKGEAIVAGLGKAYKAATKDSQRDFIRAKYELAEKVLERTRKTLSEAMTRNDRLKTDPTASAEVRLLAYDIDVRQTTAEMNEANLTMMRAALIPADQRDAATQAQFNEAQGKKTALQTKLNTLTTARNKIGTPEQQKVDYVAAEVMKLTKGLAPHAEGETPEQAQAAEDKRKTAIMKDPIGYLQEQIDNPKVGIKAILENSDVSTEDQKKLIEVATAQAEERAVIVGEVKDKVVGTGKMSILALLLLIYTSYGANKKAKSGQMG